jgi:hypothetical protein
MPRIATVRVTIAVLIGVGAMLAALLGLAKHWRSWVNRIKPGSWQPMGHNPSDYALKGWAGFPVGDKSILFSQNSFRQFV